MLKSIFYYTKPLICKFLPLILMALFFFCTPHQKKVDLGSKKSDNLRNKIKDRITSKKLYDTTQVLDTIINNDNLKFYFDNQTDSVKLQFKQNNKTAIFNICMCYSTFRTAPNIELYKLDSDQVGFVVNPNIVQLGYYNEELIFYSFNRSKLRVLFKLCQV